MKVTKLYGKGNDLVLEVTGATFTQMNTLRRVFMNEVPVMAIEDVEFKMNNSVLYDEMLALRLGLIPLTTDLEGYKLRESCTCEGAGCAKCTVQLTLNAKGPCIVYAKDLSSKDPKVKPVYPEMPIVKLLEHQRVELVATAQLGCGRDHAKHAACLAYYRQKPRLTIKKEADAKRIAAKLKKMRLDAITEKNGKLAVNEKKLALSDAPEAYEDLDEAVSLSFDEENFIFIIESWGQLSPREIIKAGFEQMQLQVKEFEKLVKSL